VSTAPTEPESAPEVPDDRPPRRLTTLVVITAVVVALDVATKVGMVAWLGDGERVPLVDGIVSFALVRNPGAAFSLGTSLTWALALAVVVSIARYARRLRSRGWAVAMGLVLGGALGNLVDRVFRGPGPLRGHVVDFVSVGWFPVFNVADSAITIGGGLLVLLALLGRDIDGTRTGDGRA
jgi:signal peptidase II